MCFLSTVTLSVKKNIVKYSPNTGVVLLSHDNMLISGQFTHNALVPPPLSIISMKPIIFVLVWCDFYGYLREGWQYVAQKARN